MVSPIANEWQNYGKGIGPIRPKKNGRPARIARTFPLSVAERLAYPPLHSLSRGHGREPLRVGHTISDATWSFSTGNNENGDPHGCPPETALIPIRSADRSTRRWRQTACKPGSVPPPGNCRKTGMAIPLGRSSPSASCDRPERRREGSPGAPNRSGAPAAPTWSCSRWGFPCRRRCRPRGALLPHHFTLAARPAFREGRRYIFCGTFPGVAPAGGYPAPCLRGARTFLSPRTRGERPSDRLAWEDLGSHGPLSKPPPRPL